MNANWTRWITASCGVYFNSIKGANTFYIEGQVRNPIKEEDFTELRFVGPEYRENTKNEFTAKIELNLLISVIQDQDNHKILRVTGFWESKFIKCISVRRYGDDDTFLGHLYRKKIQDQDIVTVPYGQVSPDTRVFQTTVESLYEIDLRT